MAKITAEQAKTKLILLASILGYNDDNELADIANMLDDMDNAVQAANELIKYPSFRNSDTSINISPIPYAKLVSALQRLERGGK